MPLVSPNLTNRIALLMAVVLFLTYTGRCVCCVILGSIPVVDVPGEVFHGGHEHHAGVGSTPSDGGSEVCWTNSSSGPLAAHEVHHFEDFVVLLVVWAAWLMALGVQRRIQMRSDGRRPAPPAPPPRFAFAVAS